MATYRHSYVFRLDVVPVFRAWTGHGLLATPADMVDPSGASWSGAAHILSVPTLRVLLNGIADRIEIKVSGTSSETIRLAMQDRAEVQNASAMIGRVEFDERWQVVGGVHWEWRGIADVLTIGSQASERGRDRAITLSLRSGDTMRSNPQPAFFTAADQRRRSPDDAFCDQVASITAGVSRRFGPR